MAPANGTQRAAAATPANATTDGAATSAPSQRVPDSSQRAAGNRHSGQYCPGDLEGHGCQHTFADEAGLHRQHHAPGEVRHVAGDVLSELRHAEDRQRNPGPAGLTHRTQEDQPDHPGQQDDNQVQENGSRQPGERGGVPDSRAAGRPRCAPRIAGSRPATPATPPIRATDKHGKWASQASSAHRANPARVGPNVRQHERHLDPISWVHSFPTPAQRIRRHPSGTHRDLASGSDPTSSSAADRRAIGYGGDAHHISTRGRELRGLTSPAANW